MARICALTGKKSKSWNNVSHSHRKTKRRFQVNLVKKKVLNKLTWKIHKIRIASSTLRTLTKDYFLTADKQFKKIQATKK